MEKSLVRREIQEIRDAIEAFKAAVEAGEVTTASQAMAFPQSCGDTVSYAQAGRRVMKVPIIVLAAAAIGLGSTASADPYKDLAAQGYRWVAVDGPYACPSKDDLREIVKHRGRDCFPQLGSGRTFTYSQVGAQKKTAWRKLYLLAASQLNLREKFLGI